MKIIWENIVEMIFELWWMWLAMIALIAGAVYFVGPDIKTLFETSESFRLLMRLSPVWAPALLMSAFWELWMRYIRANFIEKSGSLLLEIKIPREITKSPRAMELFLSGSFWQRGSATLWELFWDGKVRPWFSLEIASFGGEIHFFIWTWPKYRNIVEAQLYAQYPTIEIIEVPDYTLNFQYNPEENFLWGTQFGLEKPDAYPIMSYVDYGLDKDPKEEFKIDPITSTLEFLGSIKKGEQVWLHITIQAHTKMGLSQGFLFHRAHDWTEEAREEINHILMRDPESKSSRQVSEAGFPIIPSLTDGEKTAVEAIERSIGKPPFDVIIRGCYIAEGDAKKNIAFQVPGLIGAFRHYNSRSLNGFKMQWYTDIEDSTKDALTFLGLGEKVGNHFQEKYAHEMLHAMRLRSFFHHPFKNWHAEPFVLTAEEIATIYHFPGSVAATPTFARVMSRKTEAPPNLPI